MALLDIATVWKQLLDRTRNEDSLKMLNACLFVALPADYSNGCLTIAVGGAFAKKWIESHFTEQLQNVLTEICGEPTVCKIICAEEAPIPQTPVVEEAEPQPLKTAAEPVPAEEDESNLLPKYTFDNFVTGNSNRLARAAASAVADNPGKTYNPLFLYSDVGLGKTHLMHAIGNQIKKINPGLKVLYTSSEAFTNELVIALKNHSMSGFQSKYRNIDVLLIDDIQFLIGKTQTQEEFFHTFNKLNDANKQIVISSDRNPSELTQLEERLTSRFKWGFVADIQSPDVELRMAILRNLAEESNLEIPSDVYFYIASSVQSNIRELEGAFTRVVGYASFNGLEIDIDVARKALSELTANKNSNAVTIKDIQQLVASHYKLRIEDFSAKTRKKNIAFPRQIAMFLCRELTGYSLPDIGKFFGNRDHTTVIYACEKIAKEIKKDPLLQRSIEEMKLHLIK